MSAKPRQRSPRKEISIPVQMTELSIFDNAFALMKEKFADEMKRIEDEMNKFSKDLVTLCGHNSSAQAGSLANIKRVKPYPVTDLESLANSPLVHGEGENKSLKLQFDVSQFDPSEVNVQIRDGLLIVSATHEEKTDNSLDFREYNREFQLPEGIEPDTIVSGLSRDGVLTVHVPFPKPKDEIMEETESSPRIEPI